MGVRCWGVNVREGGGGGANMKMGEWGSGTLFIRNSSIEFDVIFSDCLILILGF